MHQIQEKTRTHAADTELIDILTAISVVSMRLARKLTLLAGESQSMKGEKTNGKYYDDNRRSAQMRYHH